VKALHAAIVRTLPLVPKSIVRRIASRYVAGETLDEALTVVASLNAQGCMATLDVLGEDITRLDETEATVLAYEKALAAIAARRLDSNISVKLTALGLKLDPGHCRAQFSRIVDAARATSNFVRIDMEDSSVTEETIRIFLEFRERYPRVGIVLQAYLRRSPEDARRIAKVGGNVRVCKGIYVEPPEIAYQDREKIREGFMELVDLLLDANSYVGIATHDPLLVERARASVARRKLPREAYEFQMLLGVAGGLRRRLVAEGHRLRVYIPYGDAWYAYSVRRLKENPSIAGNVLKGIFQRRERPL
jgi:proline dehydrogenase